MNKTVLVTGASGFIGSHLVARCLRDGCRVKALVRRGNSRIAALRGSGVEVVEGDVRDGAAVDAAVRGSDLVIHAAALTSDWGPMREFIDINVGGTRNVCESSLRHGVGRSAPAIASTNWLSTGLTSEPLTRRRHPRMALRKSAARTRSGQP